MKQSEKRVFINQEVKNTKQKINNKPRHSAKHCKHFFIQFNNRIFLFLSNTDT